MRSAYSAALLALTSAAISLYWALGGTALLRTVGGAIEDLARERSTGAIVLISAIVVAKLLAGALALSYVRPWGERVGRRLRVRLGAAGGLLLALYGGVLVLAGALVLAGVIKADGDVDEYALRWHVFFWDAWFVVWGICLWRAARSAARSAVPAG